MGGFGYDRQVFVKSKEPAPAPGRSPLPGAMVLILVAALGAFAAYRYIKAGGLSNIDADPGSGTQVQQLQHKIEVLQARIDELEKKHRVRARHAVEENDPVKETTTLRPARLPESHPAPSTSREPAEKRVVAMAAPAAVLPVAAPAASVKADPNLNGIQGALASSHQEWQATVDRLGNVVGELDAQRNQVKQNQNDVNQLLQVTRRTGISFSLSKGGRFQRVGPVAISLASTDVATQRYTVRLVVDDKSVELKDRALNEVIQFYTTHSQFPVELVILQIQRSHVAGMLSVPSDLSTSVQDVQVQSR